MKNSLVKAPESEPWMQVLKESADCVYLFEARGTDGYFIKAVNASFEEEFCITAAQCVGLRVEDILSAEVAALVTLNLSRCIADGHVLEGVVEMDTPHGKQRYQTTFVPFRDRNNKRNKVLTIKRRAEEEAFSNESVLMAGQYLSSSIFPSPDLKRVKTLTDLKAIQAEIEAQERRIRDTSDTAPFGIVVLEDRRVKYANRALLNLVGAETYEEYLEVGPLSFIQPEDRQSIMHLVDNWREGNPAINSR